MSPVRPSHGPWGGRGTTRRCFREESQFGDPPCPISNRGSFFGRGGGEGVVHLLRPRLRNFAHVVDTSHLPLLEGDVTNSKGRGRDLPSEVSVLVHVDFYVYN